MVAHLLRDGHIRTTHRGCCEANMAKQVFKTLVGPEWVQDWINSEKDELLTSLFESLIQLVHCL